MNKEELPIKDPYNPESEMDVLKSLREPKKKVKVKKTVVSSSRMSLRAKFALIFIVSSISIEILAIIGMKTTKAIGDFFDENTFAYHQMVEVKVQAPVTIEKRNPKVEYVMVTSDKVDVKPLTQDDKKKIIKNANYAKIITGIWTLETQQGKNTNPTAHHNDCGKVGLTNEFGYGALDDMCFGSFKESVDTVDKWIDEQLKTKTISQTLCFYSSGRATDTCSYAQNYSALDKSGQLALK